MGIGRPAAGRGVIDHVLAPFSQEERAHLKEWVDHAAEAAWALREETLSDISSRYSQKALPC